MADFSFPAQIEGNTPAIASEVQTNFDALKDWVLANCVQVDGSQSMGAPLNLFGQPASPTHAVPKSYVDSARLIGSISMYGGTSATVPAGFLWCDDTVVYSRFDHPDLYAIIGRSFTPETDPVDSFRVPGLNGRMPVGVSATDSTFALGEKGGQRDSELRAHVHSVPVHGHGASSSGGSHSHSVSGSAGGGNHSHAGRDKGFVYWANDYGTNQSSTTPVGPNAPWALSWQTTTDGSGEHSHTVSGSATDSPSHGHTITVNDKPAFNTVEAGGGTTLIDKNLPPYTTVRFMIYRGGN